MEVVWEVSNSISEISCSPTLSQNCVLCIVRDVYSINNDLLYCRLTRQKNA